MSAEIWLGLCLQVASSVPSSPAFPPAIDPTAGPVIAPRAVQDDEPAEKPAEEPAEEVADRSATESTEAPAADETPRSAEVTLLTVEGQSMSGELRPSIEGRIGLDSSDFTEPLVIRPDRLAAITFAQGEGDENQSQGLFEVVLADGSRLHADVLDITAETWRLNAAGMGTFGLPAASIMSADNLGGAETDGPGLVYRGPTGLAGWGQEGDSSHWTVEPGRLIATAAKARLSRDLGLGKDRDVTLRLRWKGEPHFRLFLGSRSEGGKSKLLTVEPWGDTLVAWRSDKDGMQILELMHGLEADSTCDFRFTTDKGNVTFLDGDGAELGRMERTKGDGPRLNLVSDTSGLEIANVTVLSNTDGDLALQRLSAEKVTGVEAEGQSFLTAEGAVDKVALLGIDIAEAAPPVEQREGDLWLKYMDGRRIGGAFQAVTETGLEILPAWADTPIVAEWDGLTEARVHGSEDQIKRRRSSKSFLITAKGEVAGKLETILPDGKIVWNATIAEGSATLAADAVERIVINRTTAYYVSGRKFPHLMQLRSGDQFRCVVHSITDDAILYSSPFGKDRKVDAGLVKAVEFDLRATARFAKLFAGEPEPQQNVWFGNQKEARRETSEGFDADSLERALALPRKYKKKRFEHLVLARNGDFLRTSLVGLSPEGAVYPGTSDTDRLVPKNRLAAVIWLDPTEEAAEKPTTNARVVMDENTSLSMNLSGTEGGKLIGSSPILGDLEIELPHIISIDLAPTAVHIECAYEEWVLKPMKEPFPDETAAASGGPTAGQPALETKGQDLDGESFALADFKGEVVLLEFWGHW